MKNYIVSFDLNKFSCIHRGNKSDNQRITQQFVDLVHEDNNTNGIINIGNIRPKYNVTNIEGTTQKVSSIGIPVVILMILSAYIFKRMNI